MKRAIFVFLVSVLASVTTIGGEPTPVGLIRCEPDATVGGGSGGSGFFIGPNLILTAAHAVKLEGRVRVEIDNQYYLCKVLKYNSNKDLALLEISEDGAEFYVDEFYEFAVDEPLQGSLRCKGYPRACWQVYVSEGTIVKYENVWDNKNKDTIKKVCRLSMIVRNGMSGGPLLTEQNKVVGVLSTKTSKGPPFAMFISLTEIKTFLGEEFNDRMVRREQPEAPKPDDQPDGSDGDQGED